MRMRFTRWDAPTATSGRRFGIKAKLLGAFGLLTALMIAIAVTAIASFRSQSHVVDELIDVEGHVKLVAAEADAAMLRAYAAELDYVIHFSQDGPEAAKATYVPIWEEAVAELEQRLEDINQTLHADEAAAGIRANTAAVLTHLDEYEVEFHDVISRMEARGSETTGAEASIRAAVAEIEAELQEFHELELEVKLEFLWGSARDYLGRPHDETVTAVHAGVAEFETALAASDLSTANKELISGQISDFSIRFDDLVAADEKIAAELAQMNSEVAEVEAALTDVISITTQLQEEARSGMEQAEQSAERTIVVLVVLSAVGATFAGWVLANRISRPVRKVADTARALAESDLVELQRAVAAIAEGDLTVGVEIHADEVDVSTEDEIGEMGKSFNQMIDRLRTTGTSLDDMVAKLRKVVSDAADVATQVESGSQVLASSSEESATAAYEVAESIGGVADGVNNQARIAEELSQAVARIVDEVTATAKAVKDSKTAADEAKERAAAGQKEIDQASAAMDQITDSFSVTHRTVSELGAHSEKVEEIVDLIRSIAEQTNLLALNAAIEAARAGEMGRGFAVVASEVKTLAEESASSTEQIAGIVAEMRTSVGQAVAAVETGNERVDQGAGVVKSAGLAFSSISGSVETLRKQVARVDESSSRISEATDAINSGTTGLAEIAESNSAASEQVAASSQEAAAISEEIGATAQELNASSERLTQTMNGFKLD